MFQKDFFSLEMSRLSPNFGPMMQPFVLSFHALLFRCFNRNSSANVLIPLIPGEDNEPEAAVLL